MPKLTSTNAESVPMLIISSSSSTCASPAMSATTMPAPTWSRTGVWKRCEVLETPRGSRPSRLIENMTRVRPSSRTMMTVVRPMRMPTEMTRPAQSAPTRMKAVVSEGSSEAARSVYGTMPVTTSVTRMYSTVTTARPLRMPLGMVFCGFLASSAVVATTSNPMNAKNTSAAPASRPMTPYVVGSRPVRNPNRGCSSAVFSGAGCDGGMNGV
ncbi:hypothetical protein D3C74_330330 [compost metagenome]